MLNTMILCPILGLLIGYFIPQHSSFLQHFDIIFLKLLNLIIPFMIFPMIVKSIHYMKQNISRDDNMLYVIGYYVFGTFVSVLLGVGVALYFKLGQGTDISQILGLDLSSFEMPQQKFSEIILNLIPSNIIHILYHNNLMMIFILAVSLGYIVGASQYKTGILEFLNKLYLFSLEIIDYTLCIIPYALLSITIKLTIQGSAGIGALSQIVIIFFILYAVRYVILLLEIYFIGGVSPWPFIVQSFRYQTVALISSSSKATLPIASESMKKMGVSSTSQQYGISIGGMLSGIGFGSDLSISIIFILHLYGVNLDILNILLVVFLTLIGVILGLGIPGGTVVVLTMILKMYNIPNDILAIIVIIERLTDMFCTTLIVTGLVGYTVIIDAQKGTLNKDKYCQ